MEKGKLMRVISSVAPQLVSRHLYKRVVADQLIRSYYSAANTGRTSEGWATSNATAENTNRSERDIVRARARDLERNSDLLPAEVLSLERNVVGTGIVLQAKVVTAGGEEQDEINKKIEACWRNWCHPKNCDITGRQSFSELLRMAVRRSYVDGGILLIKVYKDDHFYLQAREVDELDSSKLFSGENRVVGGVEIDAYNRPVAYWIKELDVWGWTAKSSRIESQRVIYLAKLTRPGQVREFSPAAPSLARMDDTNEFLAAALQKEKTLAFFAAFLTSTDNGMGGLFGGLGRGMQVAGPTPGRDALGNEIVLEQGAVVPLPPGSDVKSIAPSGTSSTAQEMVCLTQRMAGSAAGLSYEAVSRDLSKVSYSSARQGMLEDQRTYTQEQQYLIDHLCDEVYCDWLDWVVLSGQLPLPGYYQRRGEYQRHVWIPSGWKWIDPMKEAAANTKALESNQTTLQDICAEKGKDWRDVIEQRAMELDFIRVCQGEDIPSPAEQKEDVPKQTDEEPKPTGKKTGAAEVADEDKSIQQISLNGAQLDSLIQIVQLVVAGNFPYNSAVALLTSAFPFDKPTAETLLNNGKLFEMANNADDESDNEPLKNPLIKNKAKEELEDNNADGNTAETGE